MTVRTIVGAPLRGTEGILGVIGLARGDSSGFDEEEIALLDRFGRVAAIALDNARLHESLQVELAERRRTEEELLDTVSRLSRSELELRRAQAETIRKLADAAEFRDAETGHHTERMSRMCELIARRWGSTRSAAGCCVTQARCTTSARSRSLTRSCSSGIASPTRSGARCSAMPRSATGS